MPKNPMSTGVSIVDDWDNPNSLQICTGKNKNPINGHIVGNFPKTSQGNGPVGELFL